VYNKSRLATLFLIVFIDLVGFGIVLPLLQFIGRDFGASGWEVGLLIASFSLMQFVTSPLWGRLSDRIGRRPVLLLSLAGSTLSYVMFAVADNFAWLMISRCLAGLFGGNVTVAQAYIADITPEEGRAKGMGLIGMAFGLGFLFGPVIGGVAVGTSHAYATAGWIAAALCGVNFLAAVRVLPESLSAEGRHAAKTMPHPWISLWKGDFSKPILALLGVTFFSNLAFTIWESTFGMWLRQPEGFGYGGREFAFLLVFVGFLTAMVQGGLIGRLVKRFGERRLLGIGNVLLLAGVVLIPFCSHLGMLLPVLGFLALGNGLNRPALYGWVSRVSDVAQQGAVLGLVQSFSSLSRIVGPPIGGWLFDDHPSFPYWLAALAMGLAALCLTAAGSGPSRKENSCP